MNYLIYFTRRVVGRGKQKPNKRIKQNGRLSHAVRCRATDEQRGTNYVLSKYAQYYKAIAPEVTFLHLLRNAVSLIRCRELATVLPLFICRRVVAILLAVSLLQTTKVHVGRVKNFAIITSITFIAFITIRIACLTIVTRFDGAGN